MLPRVVRIGDWRRFKVRPIRYGDRVAWFDVHTDWSFTRRREAVFEWGYPTVEIDQSRTPPGMSELLEAAVLVASDLVDDETAPGASERFDEQVREDRHAEMLHHYHDIYSYRFPGEASLYGLTTPEMDQLRRGATRANARQNQSGGGGGGEGDVPETMQS